MRLNALLRVKFIKISLFLAGLMLSSLAYAIAPVVDAYEDSSASIPASAQCLVAQCTPAP